MPVPIKFGTKELVKNTGDKKNEKEIKEIVDDIINITDPAWTKQPKDLDDQNYKDFYRELYPMNFEEPLFNKLSNLDNFKNIKLFRLSLSSSVLIILFDISLKIILIKKACHVKQMPLPKYL